MASVQIVDIESLIQPISADAPQGSDPRGSALYGSIKDARNTARAAERASLFDADSAANIMSQWRPILQSAPKLLSEQGKDLEIACWYLETLIRHHGITGLRDGFALLDALVENFWNGLFPEPDEDGLETKVAPLTGLNGDGGEGTLLAPIRNLAITAVGGGNFDSFTFWQYQQAVDTDKLADPTAREERAARLGFSLADVRQAVAASPDAYYVELLDELDNALDSYKQLHGRLRQHCGNQAPPSSAISALLEDVQRALRFLTKDKLAHLQAQPEAAPAESTPAAAGGAAAPATAAATAPGISAGPIASRDEALRRLSEVAQYFRATEPHTPIASGIERLVRWGRMSVAELMMELMPDATARAIYGQLTGVVVSASGETAPAVVAPAPVPAPAPAPAPAASTSSW